MNLAAIRRSTTGMLVMIPLGIVVAYLFAFADHTLPHDSVTIWFSLAIACGIAVATFGATLIYYSAANYWLWLGGWTALAGFVGLFMGVWAWLVSQRWETLTAGTSDQYLVTMTLACYGIGYLLSLVATWKWALDFEDPGRMIRPWVHEDWQPADLDQYLKSIDRYEDDESAPIPLTVVPSPEELDRATPLRPEHRRG